MSGDSYGRHVMDENDIISVTNIDRFRASLKCDLFIPSYVHSLSIATEFIYNYVLSKFPKDYFKTIHIAGKHPFDDFRKFEVGNLVTRENPAVAISYSLQYDYNDNDVDYNLLSTNKYLRRSQWERSFFKCPHRKLYVGMDLEAMMINYNFRFKVNTRAQQLDLFNRMRKVFRIGCTETVDIDCDFHMDPTLIEALALESGFSVDDDNHSVNNPWEFAQFLNAYSQMPILYKLRNVNQHYEYFLRMRNLPIHLDFQNQLDVDDGNQSGMTHTDFGIEFQIGVRFPAPRTFSLYNEGKWIHGIKVEPNTGIKVYSMKVIDIPEENYKHWPIYGHSEYQAEPDEESVKEINIKELFKAPVDVKVGSSLDDIIQDAINQFINPDVFIEIAVYTNDLAINGSGRIPISMDWNERKIILPDNINNAYFYIAIYIDRGYVNNKVVEFTNADKNRISTSNNRFYEKELQVRKVYSEEPIIEESKFNTNTPKTKRKKALFIANK